jgi:hypothetical protein
MPVCGNDTARAAPWIKPAAFYPGSASPRIVRLLRSLRNQDPAGAKEFSFDAWMLVDQDVG